MKNKCRLVFKCFLGLGQNTLQLDLVRYLLIPSQCLAKKSAALTHLSEAYSKPRSLVQQLTSKYHFDFLSGLKLLSVTIQ